MASHSDKVLIHVTTVPLSLFFLAGQADYFRNHGFATHVISSPGYLLDEFQKSENVTAHELTMSRKISPLQDLAALWHLVRKFKEIKPHIVHAHTPKAGLLAMIASRLVRVPSRVYQIHGLPLSTATKWKRMILRMSERLACALATDVLCVSTSLLGQVLAEKLVSRAKVAVLLNGSANGIDSTRFDPQAFTSEQRVKTRAQLGVTATTRIIAFVGRMVHDKGIEDLVDAWRILREDYNDVSLLMIGPYEETDTVKEGTKAYIESDPRIITLGEIPP